MPLPTIAQGEGCTLYNPLMAPRAGLMAFGTVGSGGSSGSSNGEELLETMSELTSDSSGDDVAGSSDRSRILSMLEQAAALQRKSDDQVRHITSHRVTGCAQHTALPSAKVTTHSACDG
jgi:hypothetical protein